MLENLYYLPKEIAEYCIDENAKIEEGSRIILQTSPDGKRHTLIGRAAIEPGVTIKALAHIEDGVKIETGAIVNFRSTVKKNSYIGKDLEIGSGTTVGADCKIYGLSIGNFTHIGDSTEVNRMSTIGSSSMIAAGMYISGDIGHHTKIRPIEKKPPYTE